LTHEAPSLPSRPKIKLRAILQADKTQASEAASDCVPRAGTVAPPVAQTSYYDGLSVSDHVVLSRDVKFEAAFGLNDASSRPATADERAMLTWHLNKRDTLSGSFRLNSLGSSIPIQNGFSVPASLAFDCAQHTALGAGPGGNAAEASKTSSFDASFEHDSSKVWLQASAFSQIEHGAVLNAYASGLTLPQNGATDQYLASASGLFATAAGCGRVYALQPKDLLLNESLVGDARYEGLRISGRLPIIAGAILAPFYSLTSAHALESSFGTTMAVSEQIPGVPLQRYGAALDWLSPRKAVELAANVSHTASNNANALPAFTIVGMAARAALPEGRLTVSVSNVFNQFAFRFGSPAYAAPLTIPGVRQFRPIPIPLRPRTFTITYAFASGRTNYQRNDLTEDNSPEAETTFRALPITDRTAGPYAINRENAQCGPEQLPVIKSVLDALRAYVGSGRYVPQKELPYGEFAMYRPGSRGAPFFLIGGRKATVINDLFSCVVVHGGTAAQISAARMYVPTTLDRDFQLAFSPKVGFYFSYDSGTAQVVRANIKPFPSELRQTRHFEVDSSATGCSGVVLSTATYVLGELRDYFEGSRKVPAGIEITRGDSEGHWYRIHIDDELSLIAVRACASIYRVPIKEAAQLSLGGVADSSLLYAPAVGLYTTP
jgi:hypothetical protein